MASGNTIKKEYRVFVWLGDKPPMANRALSCKFKGSRIEVEDGRPRWGHMIYELEWPDDAYATNTWQQVDSMEASTNPTPKRKATKPLPRPQKKAKAKQTKKGRKTYSAKSAKDKKLRVEIGQRRRRKAKKEA